ncbi:MAG: hypothetical protein AAF206_02235 [Bacteroidota bacterium]
MSKQHNWIQDWGAPMQLGGCSNCQRVFLSPRTLPEQCPWCHAPAVTAMDAIEDHPVEVFPPEAWLSHRVDASNIRAGMERFFADVPFAPTDLNYDNQLQRLEKLYVPMWWVDAKVDAMWQAEVGHHYEVKSHKEAYGVAGWHTTELREKRIAWEWRGGKVEKSFDNTPTPALTDYNRMLGHLGDFATEGSRPYEASCLDNAYAVLPDHSVGDAWEEAKYRLDQIARENCLAATEGVQIREFRWSPEFQHQNWTQLLMPVLTTYYLDDEGKRQPIYIHGQTAVVHGNRRASEKKAVRRSNVLLLISLLLVVGIVMGALFLSDRQAILPIVIVPGITALILALVSFDFRTKAKRFNESEIDGWG